MTLLHEPGVRIAWDFRSASVDVSTIFALQQFLCLQRWGDTDLGGMKGVDHLN